MGFFNPYLSNASDQTILDLMKNLGHESMLDKIDVRGARAYLSNMTNNEDVYYEEIIKMHDIIRNKMHDSLPDIPYPDVSETHYQKMLGLRKARMIAHANANPIIRDSLIPYYKSLEPHDTLKYLEYKKQFDAKKYTSNLDYIERNNNKFADDVFTEEKYFNSLKDQRLNTKLENIVNPVDRPGKNIIGKIGWKKIGKFAAVAIGAGIVASALTGNKKERDNPTNYNTNRNRFR